MAGTLGAPDGSVVGSLLVQMLDGSRIRVEAVQGSGAPTAFSKARIYTR